MVSVSQSGLERVCKAHNIRALYLFGSQARGEGGPDSDVDLLVRFGPADDPLAQFVDAREDLGRVFGRPVDLVEESGILSPRFKARVAADRVALYDAGS